MLYNVMFSEHDFIQKSKTIMMIYNYNKSNIKLMEKLLMLISCKPTINQLFFILNN